MCVCVCVCMLLCIRLDCIETRLYKDIQVNPYTWRYMLLRFLAIHANSLIYTQVWCYSTSRSYHIIQYRIVSSHRTDRDKHAWMNVYIIYIHTRMHFSPKCQYLANCLHYPILRCANARILPSRKLNTDNSWREKPRLCTSRVLTLTMQSHSAPRWFK